MLPIRNTSKQRVTLPPHYSKDIVLHSRKSSKVKTPEGRTSIDSLGDEDELGTPRAEPITVKRRLSNFAMRGSSKQHPHDIVDLAQSLHMPWEDLKNAVHLFKQHAGNLAAVDFQDIALTKEQFSKVFCEMCHVESLDQISPELLQSTFRTADRDGNGNVDIEEFALWFSSHSFSEEIVLDKASLEVRRLARKLDLPLMDIDRYKKTFDKYDTDGSGLIEYDEFDDLLQSLLKTTEALRLPHERVQNLWRSADTDGSGELDFEEFVAFYMRYFDDREGQNDPVQGFYRGLRKVSSIQ